MAAHMAFRSSLFIAPACLLCGGLGKPGPCDYAGAMTNATGINRCIIR